MRKINAFLSLVLILSTLLTACGSTVEDPPLADDQTDSTIDNTRPEGSDTRRVFDSDEDRGFAAQVTSGISVDLSWEPIDGATGYRIENQFGESEWFVLVELAADVMTYEDFLAPSNMELNYRLTPLLSSGDGKPFNTTVTTPEVVPNPYSVRVILEEPDYSDIGLDIPGFDPETFDPSTFDPSSLDLSAFDPENLDLSSLSPEPVSALGSIGPEGGSLSVTGKNGVVYTLEVAPDGLAFPVLFRLTPIAEIERYPFAEEWQAAVDIQPGGIYFDIPATVTFQIPVDESASAQVDPDIFNVGFAFDLGGGEFHLTPIEDKGISVSRFSESAAKLASPDRTLFNISQSTLNRTTSAGAGPVRRSAARDFIPENAPSRPSDQADANRAAEDIEAKADTARAERAAESLRMRLGQGGVQKFTDTLFADFAAFYRSPLFKLLSDASRERLWKSAAAQAVYHLQNTQNQCPSEDAVAQQELVRRIMRPRTAFEGDLAHWFLRDNPSGRLNLLKMHAAVRSCKVELIVSSFASIADEQCKAEFFVKAEVPLTWHYDGEPFLQGSNHLTYEPVQIGQGFNPGKAICEEYSFDNLASSGVLVSYLQPIFSGMRHTDWTMIKQGTGGLSAFGQVRKIVRVYLQADDVPPTRYTSQSSSFQDGYSDPWGGIISLVGVRSKIWPGSSKWKLGTDLGNPILAEWDLGLSALASGDGWKAEHRTILTIMISD